jgi:hypothetical protein
VTAVFEAKYAGTCDSCTERIKPGDLVTYTDDVIVHADCEEHAVPERKTETCTECWLIKPCQCEVTA